MESSVIVDESLEKVEKRKELVKKITHEVKLYLYHLECKGARAYDNPRHQQELQGYIESR